MSDAAAKTTLVIGKLKGAVPPADGPSETEDASVDYEDTYRAKAEYALDCCDASLEDEAKARAWLKKNIDNVPDDLKARAQAHLDDSAE